jgi:hypothetical protein
MRLQCTAHVSRVTGGQHLTGANALPSAESHKARCGSPSVARSTARVCAHCLKQRPYLPSALVMQQQRVAERRHLRGVAWMFTHAAARDAHGLFKHLGHTGVLGLTQGRELTIRPRTPRWSRLGEEF